MRKRLWANRSLAVDVALYESNLACSRTLLFVESLIRLWLFKALLTVDAETPSA
jgi:hypothetical protein